LRADEFGHRGDEACPLCVLASLRLHSQDLALQGLELAKCFRHEAIGSIHVNLVLILVHYALSHYLLVLLRDDGDEEIQQYDQNKELIGKPEQPNEEYHNFARIKLS
jgi:hypothetical protein